MKIQNSVILITGGSSGIGKSIAQLLSRLGGIIYICDIQLNEMENESKDKIKFIKCNVSVEIEVKEMIDQIFNENGKIDVVINNAGISGIPESNSDSIEKSLKNFHNIYQVNILGVLLVSKYAAEKMIKTYDLKNDCNGLIVMISSVLGIHGMKGLSSYSSSKSSLIGMSLPMARDLGKYKIRVNSICPGFIPTPLTENFPAPIESIKKSIPLNRLGSTSDIAQVCQFIIGNDYINGSVIKIDGGMVASF